MNKLLGTKFFILANEKLHVKENAEIKSAYDEFVLQIQSIVEKESDYIKVIRTLNQTRIELIIIDSYSTSGKEKNVQKEYLTKARLLIESELQILYLQIKSCISTRQSENQRRLIGVNFKFTLFLFNNTPVCIPYLLYFYYRILYSNLK
jgi:hypothetical protein